MQKITIWHQALAKYKKRLGQIFLNNEDDKEISHSVLKKIFLL